MLRYNDKGEIEAIYPAQKIKAYKDLVSKYNDKELKDILEVAYNMYNPDSIFIDFLPEDRLQKIISDILEDKYDISFFRDDVIDNFFETYKEYSMTPIQRDYERCKKDMDDLHKHISRIPFYKTVKIKKDVEVFVKELNKNIVVTVDTEVEIDNSKEKIEAISVREKLYNIDQKLRKLVREEKMTQHTSAKTMFE